MPTIKKRGRTVKQQTPEEEFRSIAHQVSDMAAPHKKNLTIIAIVVVAVLIVALGYRFMRSQQEQKAAPLVASASNAYNAVRDYGRALELFRSVQKQ